MVHKYFNAWLTRWKKIIFYKYFNMEICQHLHLDRLIAIRCGHPMVDHSHCNMWNSWMTMLSLNNMQSLWIKRFTSVKKKKKSYIEMGRLEFGLDFSYNNYEASMKWVTDFWIKLMLTLILIITLMRFDLITLLYVCYLLCFCSYCFSVIWFLDIFGLLLIW